VETVKQLEIKIDKMGANDWEYKRDPVYHTLKDIKGKATMIVRRDGVRMTARERGEQNVDEAGLVIEERVVERALVIEQGSSEPSEAERAMRGVIARGMIPSFHNWPEADRFAWDRVTRHREEDRLIRVAQEERDRVRAEREESYARSAAYGREELRNQIHTQQEQVRMFFDDVAGRLYQAQPQQSGNPYPRYPQFEPSQWLPVQPPRAKLRASQELLERVTRRRCITV
jgi:hypothetical protein